MGEVEPESKPQVFLVDDDEDLSAVVRFFLERDGYRVTYVSDGRQAKEMIHQTGPPGLILLDLMLPYCSGTELLQLIRSQPKWNRVPVVMLTAVSAEENIVSLLDAGANDYVTKPFNPKELAARLRRFLRPPA
jgi:DNA-binding response OmpR family regulator